MSNASKDMFPENKPDHFIIHLAEPISLSGAWVAALAELHYGCQFVNHVDPSKLSDPSKSSAVVDQASTASVSSENSSGSGCRRKRKIETRDESEEEGEERETKVVKITSASSEDGTTATIISTTAAATITASIEDDEYKDDADYDDESGDWIRPTSIEGDIPAVQLETLRGDEKWVEHELKYIVKKLRAAEVWHVNMEMLRTRIESLKDDADKIVEDLTESDALYQKHPDIRSEAEYAANKLRARGMTNISKLQLLNLIKGRKKRNETLDSIIDRVLSSASKDGDNSVATRKSSKVTTETTLKKVDDVLEMLLGKAESVQREIVERRMHNDGGALDDEGNYVAFKKKKTLALQRYQEKFIKRAVELLKKDGVNFTDYGYLQKRLKLEVPVNKIVQEIKQEQNRRLLYDRYAESVRGCKTVPKQLYVYCDIVEVQQVGDAFGSLLRVVHVPDDGRKRAVGDWGAAPHWKPVSKNYFHQLEIDIRDEQGCPVSFKEGPVIGTVFLKRVL